MYLLTVLSPYAQRPADRQNIFEMISSKKNQLPVFGDTAS
jgi:anthranilate/para-aminobenzoate synthase component II